MKSKRLTVIINRPIDVVFRFTLDPKNTSKWIEGIQKEVTNEWPSKKGTIYKNQAADGSWNEYELVEFVEGATFTLSRIDGDYHVRYIFSKINQESTKFEYYEWVESGELDNTVSQKVLEKLREVLENEN